MMLDNATRPYRTGYVTVAGQRLRYSVANEGCGVPLVLINGIGATGDLYDTLRSHMGERETIAFDAPGVHRSPAPLLPLTMADYADRVSGLITGLGHSEVDLLGVSWGGALAQEVAHRHPRKVRRLVLAATTPGLGSALGRPAALALLMTPARYYSPSYLRRIAPTLYGGAILDHPELLEEHARVRNQGAPSPRGYLYQLLAISGFTSLHYLHRLRQPTLVLAGDDDPIIPLENGRRLAQHIPRARLEVVAGGGHLFLFTRAAKMARVIGDFLDEHRPDDAAP